jgi:putative membrane protein
MTILKNMLYFLLLLGALALGTLFAVQNTVTVPLDLLVVYLPERSIALWVLLAFAGGGVIGMLTSIGLVLRLRGELKRLKRAQAKAAVPPAKAAAPVATSAPDTDSKGSDSKAKQGAS